MRELETLLGISRGCALGRTGTPRRGTVSGFLALGGVLLAFLPGGPSFTVPSELALALFIAPVLGSLSASLTAPRLCLPAPIIRVRRASAFVLTP